MVKRDLKDKLGDLPAGPGVYMMKNSTGKIIYIGKAKNLRNRVRSYFNNSRVTDPKVAALQKQISDFELLLTDNEVEALILEANLIKRHRPRYNINLKDDKRYPYLKLTMSEKFPRLIVTRRMVRDGSLYFGPYANAKAMRETHRMLTTMFRLRTCNLKIPHPRNSKYKVCLQYHIKRCSGPCEDILPAEAYGREIRKVTKFLQGRSSDLLKELTEEMKQFGARQEFEEAARVRDQIKAVKSVSQKQKVSADHAVDRDIIAFARSAADLSVVVLQVRKGLLIGRQNYYLKAKYGEGDSDIAASFIEQYYLDSTLIPEEIFCSLRVKQSELIKKWLRGKRGAKVALKFPQIGDKQRLVEMAEANARLLLSELLAQKQERADEIPRVVAQLQKDLYLQNPPYSISAFDISNLGETDPVGSMVFFRNGKPVKKNYRHFKIRTITGQDDFAMMNEVVSRYFTRVLSDEAEMPDLCLIDGGRGQLNAALQALAELGLSDLQICGLAKRLDEIVLPTDKKMLSLPRTSPSLKLLQRVRDEAHRFAVTYHKKLRDRRTVRSELDSIRGVGPKRKEELLKRFGSLEKIATAPFDQLKETVKSEKLALSIQTELKKLLTE